MYDYVFETENGFTDDIFDDFDEELIWGVRWNNSYNWSFNDGDGPNTET